ncbi:hypothetical protein FEM48_Zijuj09G0217100 [Ziziphus jujuba var. spinosa]|uniref:Disease resistance R13L4/SHOC-2-like LRR domain-containing protein n=1 Tax=Ziziphus jujuba var. spinosa TaxID=714518 RepID=A0A978UVH1_ZIZJJ|nr:hypothetical protein FEM48_Zijuj09G0217100 [Ziziphus jujuba var. spinosa]
MSSIDLEEASDWLEVTNSLPSLEVLRLSYCNLNFIFRAISHVNFSSLSLLDLSYNYLGNNIPSWVSNLRSLTSLYLSGIANGASIPDGIQNLTFLVHLDLSDNSLNTSMPSWLYSLSHLEVLNLAGNQLTGTISSEIKNMTSIITLDLSGNELQGDLPTSSMAQLCKLKEIELSVNPWNLPISQILDSCSGCLSDSLQVLNIRGGQIYGNITNKIGQFKTLTSLDLFNNSISGPIPASLGNLSSLTHLELSSNSISGPILASLGNISSLTHLELSSNSISGPIPASLGNLSSLRVVFLGYNHISETLPESLGQLVNLEHLEIYKNQIEGIVSEAHFANTTKLQYLDLSQNQMHGRIPNLTNMGMLEYSAIDLSQNHFEGPLPLVSSKVYELDLSDNLLSGSISQFLCSSPSEPMNMAALDLAKNRLHSSTSYVEAALLLIKGKPIEYNKTLALVNIMDLSGNSLSGHIPLEITNLSNLLSLNLSNNLLDGEIPVKIGTQLQSFNSSSFVGNKLCGPPLTPNCSTNGEVTVVEKNRKEDDHEMSWFYIGMAVGFIVGFWGFCGSLIFNRTWRHSYFRFLDCIKDQIYVASVLKLRWFREMITSCYNNQ